MYTTTLRMESKVQEKPKLRASEASQDMKSSSIFLKCIQI